MVLSSYRSRGELVVKGVMAGGGGVEFKPNVVGVVVGGLGLFGWFGGVSHKAFDFNY